MVCVPKLPPGIDFVEHINNTFYDARQFGIRDPNAYILYFVQAARRQRNFGDAHLNLAQNRDR